MQASRMASIAKSQIMAPTPSGPELSTQPSGLASQNNIENLPAFIPQDVSEKMRYKGVDLTAFVK